MKNKKMHKLDVIFIVGIIIIAIIGGMIDLFAWKDVEYGGFPVFSCLSIYISYAWLIILYIYSFFKYKEKQGKPELIKWFMFFLLPIYHLGILLIGMIVLNLIINIFRI